MYRNRNRQIRATATVAATLLLLAVTLGSCTKELADGELPSSDGESIAVHITFPKNGQPQAADAVAKSTTRATTDPGTEAERQIDKMTIFVFKTNGTLENVLDIDLSSANPSLPDEQPGWEDGKTLVVRPITDKSSPKRVYAVANWDETDFDKATYTEGMLNGALSTITSVKQLATPLLMSGSSSVNFSTSDSKVTIALERQVAKLNISLTVDAATRAALPNIDWLTTQAQVAVGNIPDRSYVMKQPTWAELPEDWPLLFSGFMPMTDVSASDDLIWNRGIYVYENLLRGENVLDKNKNYIMISLPYRNKNTGVEEPNNYYKVYINNSDATNTGQVLRNTIYNLKLRVMGLGESSTGDVTDVDIEAELIVNPWEEFDFGADSRPRYFNISRNRIEFQLTETVHKATITSEISDWKLTDADGTTLFSFAEGKTTSFTEGVLTYAISGTASSATITITRNSTATFAEQAMTLIARNIRVPFTVADNSNGDDNGLIPNSVLEATGWTASAADRPTGVQIAKRGNVLPSGVALPDDPVATWSTENFNIMGTELDVGFGKANTALILARDAATTEDYPAVNLCKELGDGWYLPSRGELEAIGGLVGRGFFLLGSSYTFVGYESYWSSTQWNISDAWLIVVNDGGGNMVGKTNSNLMVRCIKNI